jgi:hypothetical protein
MASETRSLTQGSPIEARADESRMMEPPAEGEPLPDTHIPVDDIELRSLLATSLRPSAFPADREVLVAVAREENAPEAIVLWLGTLPSDTEFPTLEAAWEALGGTREERGRIDEPAPEPATAPEPEAVAGPFAEPFGERVESAPPPEAETAETHISPVQRVVGVAVGLVECAVGAGVYVVQRVRRLF